MRIQNKLTALKMNGRFLTDHLLPWTCADTATERMGEEACLILQKKHHVEEKALRSDK